jgi:hypothetical protein
MRTKWRAPMGVIFLALVAVRGKALVAQTSATPRETLERLPGHWYVEFLNANAEPRVSYGLVCVYGVAPCAPDMNLNRSGTYEIFLPADTSTVNTFSGPRRKIAPRRSLERGRWSSYLNNEGEAVVCFKPATQGSEIGTHCGSVGLTYDGEISDLRWKWSWSNNDFNYARKSDPGFQAWKSR